MTERRYVGVIVDAVLNEWRSGIRPDNGEASDWLAAWWETDECSDAALEMAHAIVQGLNEAGIFLSNTKPTEGET